MSGRFQTDHRYTGSPNQGQGSVHQCDDDTVEKPVCSKMPVRLFRNVLRPAQGLLQEFQRLRSEK